jgi:hypothetical protein
MWILILQVSWVMIACTRHVPLVLAAVGFAGVSAAGQAVSSVYIAEISHVRADDFINTYVLTKYVCLSRVYTDRPQFN